MKARTPEEQKALSEKASATRAAKKAERVVKEDLVYFSTESFTHDADGQPNPPIPQFKTAEEATVNMKSGMESAQDDGPAVNNGNGMAINKPITHYNTVDTTPIRREATSEEVAANKEDDVAPRKLILGNGPGNLIVIKWERGGGRVPKNCQGGWNNKQRALEAIFSARKTPDFIEAQQAE